MSWPEFDLQSYLHPQNLSDIFLWTVILSLFPFWCLCLQTSHGPHRPRLFLRLCQWGRRRRAEMLAGQTIRISWHVCQRKRSNDTESGWPHGWLFIHVCHRIVFISLSSPADKCFKWLTVLRNDLIPWYSDATEQGYLWLLSKLLMTPKTAVHLCRTLNRNVQK